MSRTKVASCREIEWAGILRDGKFLGAIEAQASKSTDLEAKVDTLLDRFDWIVLAHAPPALGHQLAPVPPTAPVPAPLPPAPVAQFLIFLRSRYYSKWVTKTRNLNNDDWQVRIGEGDPFSRSFNAIFLEEEGNVEVSTAVLKVSPSSSFPLIFKPSIHIGSCGWAAISSTSSWILKSGEEL